MKNLGDLLKEADPLLGESEPSAADRNAQRQAIVTMAATTASPKAGSRRRIPNYSIVILIAIVIFAAGSRLWWPYINNAQAAVQFEARLTEQKPGPDLKEVKMADGETLYLHNEVIVTNSDIAEAKAVPQPKGSKYEILITFTPAAAQKMRAATEKNIGKRMAVLIDGEVVIAPYINEATGEAAKIDAFTKEEAERIVAGIMIH
jgi:hypothetical protein